MEILEKLILARCKLRSDPSTKLGKKPFKALYRPVAAISLFNGNLISLFNKVPFVERPELDHKHRSNRHRVPRVPYVI